MNALESNPTAALILAVIAGLVVGFVLASLIFRNRGSQRQEAQAREEYNTYKADVNDHFIGTAKLIDGLTDSYKALFDHLQDGAGKLLDEETLRERLAAVALVIMLSRLGSAAAVTEAANDSAPAAAEDSTPAAADAAEETTAEAATESPDAPTSEEASDGTTETASESGEPSPEAEEATSDDSVSESEPSADEQASSTETTAESETQTDDSAAENDEKQKEAVT